MCSNYFSCLISYTVKQKLDNFEGINENNADLNICSINVMLYFLKVWSQSNFFYKHLLCIKTQF